MLHILFTFIEIFTIFIDTACHSFRRLIRLQQSLQLFLQRLHSLNHRSLFLSSLAVDLVTNYFLLQTTHPLLNRQNLIRDRQRQRKAFKLNFRLGIHLRQRQFFLIISLLYFLFFKHLHPIFDQSQPLLDVSSGHQFHVLPFLLLHNHFLTIRFPLASIIIPIFGDHSSSCSILIDINQIPSQKINQTI